jgi:hypothetical protein
MIHTYTPPPPAGKAKWGKWIKQIPHSKNKDTTDKYICQNFYKEALTVG